MRFFLSALVLSILLLSPKMDFGQYLSGADFGRAKNLALYTINGAVTNTADPSSTMITGDLGSAVGAVSGYTNHITGNIYTQASPAATLAGYNTDIRSVQSYLNGLIPTVTDASAPTYGTAAVPKVLTPGIYHIGGAVSITNLTLDGQGNANAVFVFNCDVAVTATPGAVMHLTNKATVLNVYWNAGGAIVLHPSATIIGTVITTNALSYEDGAALSGSGFSTGGAIVTTNNKLIGAQQSYAATSLPVALLSLNATERNGNALLSWTTASETNSKNFTVETSNGANGPWLPIGTVAAAGLSRSFITYSFLDKNLSVGDHYYRLRSIDIDDKYAFSNTFNLTYTGTTSSVSVKAYPNPVVNSVTILGAAQGTLIKLVDMSGRILLTKTAGNVGVDLMETNNLKSGNYLLKIVSTEGISTTIKISKF